MRHDILEKIIKFEAIVSLCRREGTVTVEYDGFNYIF